MKLKIDTNTMEGYRTFLAVKRLPTYRFVGHIAEFPDEYADRLFTDSRLTEVADYRPIDGLFDYQRDISRLAIQRRKFAVFAEPGLGKTLMMLEFARHAQQALGPTRRVLIISPLMVVRQTMGEMKRFYGESGLGDFSLESVASGELSRWIQQVGSAIGITNYEALRNEIPRGRLGALLLDESSIMKSHYGKYASQCIKLGEGLDWKLCLTGTPAPNDRIEYANHAVFLDAFPTVNSFLARFFVNRGQTNERWEMKTHAIGPFYKALSHWCIFLSNPSTYGWRDNVGTIPPIYVHIHDVALTTEQRSLVGSELGTLFAGDIGGITTRSKLSQLANGKYNGRKIESNKPAFIREQLVNTWPEESTLIWCKYNDEQDGMEKTFPEAGSIKGATPYEKRVELIEAFQSNRLKVLISKPDVLGFGLNLQIATRQVFSSLEDSYEEFYQAVKRSNRVDSTRPLNVHIPVTDVELPMVENVLRKAKRIQEDTDCQELLFKSHKESYLVRRRG